MVKGRLIAAAALAAILVVAGCSGAKQQNQAPAPAPTVQETKPADAKPADAKPAAEPADAKPATAQAGSRYAVVASESKATYTVKEKFANRELPNDAVGSTSAFQGELVLENGAVRASKVTVDLRTLKSDQDRRDNRLKTDGLESNKYPFAEFTLTGMEGIQALPADGKEASFKLKGTMKIHGTEKPMVFDAKGQLQGDMVKLITSVKFNMKDFAIVPPSIAGMLTVDENVKLDVQVVAKKS